MRAPFVYYHSSKYSKYLSCPSHPGRRQRRGAALVLSIFLVAMLLVVSAVAIDFGHINVSRSELKRSADAAAMSGAWELFDVLVQGDSPTQHHDTVADAAENLALKNTVSSMPPYFSQQHDVELGHYSLKDGVFNSFNPSEINAVRVNLNQNSDNGTGVPLFFGSVTGRNQQTLSTSSTAALLQAVAGFQIPDEAGETIDLLPIALDEETWLDVIAGQPGDDLKWDGTQTVNGSDGYCECSLYPERNGSAGNRGTVDIGGSNNSTSDLSRQILHGISKQDMIDLGHDLCFDANGELELNGDTGISAGIKDELADIIGQPRIIPIFSKVTGNGNNATYTIVAFEGVRILDVRLTGPMKKKHVTIQACPMIARHAVLSDKDYAQTDYLYTPVMLVE